MKEHDFTTEHAADWARLESDLTLLENGNHVADTHSVSARFQKSCHDLAIARHRMYSAELLDRLNDLVIRGSRFFSVNEESIWWKMGCFLLVGFPSAVRRDWRLFWVSTLAFLIPFAWAMLAVQDDTTWAYSLLGAEGMSNVEDWYGEENGLKEQRDSFGSNFQMFGHYIRNNVQIDIQIFAGGLLAGVGTMFFLIFNGVYIGAFAGYANVAADKEQFYSFVIGHSSLELIGMVIAGMAGLRIGAGILFPGRLRRGESLAKSAERALPFVYGGCGMTFLAAFVEGFWSAQDHPAETKYWVGGILWAIVVAYFLVAGRGKEEVAR